MTDLILNLALIVDINRRELEYNRRELEYNAIERRLNAIDKALGDGRFEDARVLRLGGDDLLAPLYGDIADSLAPLFVRLHRLDERLA